MLPIHWRNYHDCDAVNITPGQRYDRLVEAREAGIWASHCHILSHVENRSGLFGMVTPFVITEEQTVIAKQKQEQPKRLLLFDSFSE